MAFREKHRGHRAWEVGRGMGRGMGFGIRRGEFTFLVLLRLRERPAHGYALMQDIEKTYQRPVSAGLVYPTRQELEDRGFASATEQEGKKVYSITSQGRKFLEDNAETVARLEAGSEYADTIGRFDCVKNLRDIRDMLITSSDYINVEKMKKIDEILAEARKKVAAVVYA